MPERSATRGKGIHLQKRRRGDGDRAVKATCSDVDQLPVLAASVEAKICHANKLFAMADNVM